jgi:hypothetical protein
MPQIGMIVTVYGRKCRIFAVRSFGTVDVVTLEGDKAWRVSGLSFI